MGDDGDGRGAREVGAAGVRPVHDDAGRGRGLRMAVVQGCVHRGGCPGRRVRVRRRRRRVPEPGEGARGHLRVRRMVRAGVQDGHGPRQGSIRHQSLRRRRHAHRRGRHRPPRRLPIAVPRVVLRRVLPPRDRRWGPAVHAEHIHALRQVPGRRIRHLVRRVHALRGDTPGLRRGHQVRRDWPGRYLVRRRQARGSDGVVRHGGGVRGVRLVAHAEGRGVQGIGAIPRREEG